jgi:hypothetical protein
MRPEQLSEGVRRQEVAFDLVLEVELPVEPDGAGDVRLGVQGGLLVDLDDPDAGVVEMVLHPLRVDEHVFRVHGGLSSGGTR